MHAAATAAKSLQSCPTLWDPIDGSPPDSPVPGILQTRTLEWVAIPFSNARKWKVKVKSLSCVWLLATSWTAAYQAPLSMGFSRQEYWRGVPLPSPIDMHSPLYNKSILQMITYGCENSVFQRYALNLLVVTLLPREEDHSTSPRNCLPFLQVRFIRKKSLKKMSTIRTIVWLTFFTPSWQNSRSHEYHKHHYASVQGVISDSQSLCVHACSVTSNSVKPPGL